MADRTSAGVSPARALASPGLHGRACKACATAKARCVPSPNSEPKCQRCQRLGKSCEQAAAAPRRKLDKKIRVSKLEEKLDNLVTLLNTASTRIPAAESVQKTSALPTPQSLTSSPSNVEVVLNLASHNSLPVGDVNSIEIEYDRSGQDHSISPFIRTASQEINELQLNKANELLGRFREMSYYFPFIIIPPTIDARTLLRERPFLYKVVMAMAERSSNSQKDQTEDVIQYLALHMLQLGEKSLDMLLGVLVLAAWFHLQLPVSMSRFTNLLHQALALLYDLGLHKASHKNLRALCLEERSAGRSRAMDPTTNRTLEERRAALGCFFLVSGATSYFQNIQSMRWSSYLEECLEELQKFKEYDTDRLLIKYVRMEQMVEKINSSPWFDGTNQQSDWKLYPPTLFIKATQKELQVFKNDLQVEFTQDPTLFSFYYSVEMTLYEIGLLKTHLPDAASPSDFQRLEILYACLGSVGNYFEKFLELPLSAFWSISIIHFSQFAFALNILQRLSIFEDPTWDLQYVAERLKFSQIVDQVCNRMEEAHRSGAMVPSDASASTSIFIRVTTKLRKLSELFEAQMAFEPLAPEQMSNLDTGDAMNLENMVGFWESDWFDITSGSGAGF